MHSGARKRLTVGNNAYTDTTRVKSVQKRSPEHIFDCFWLFFGSAETLHALSPTFNRFQAHARIPEFQHVFSSWLLIFNSLSTIFSCFFLIFPSAFTYSLLILSIFNHLFNCFYPNSSVTAYFHLFFNINFNYFHSFSTILDKNCFTLSSYSQTGSGRVNPGLGQVGPTHLTWPLTLCRPGQAMKNLARPWPCPWTE